MNDLEYSKEQLDEMYDKLKTTLSDERIELLHRYFNAMNNFYQTIPLKRMLRIINSQNDEPYSEEDFLAFAEIVRHERHFYYIVGREELYDDVPESKPIERELVHESLLEFDIYYEMFAHKLDKPYYVPPKDELLKYEDDFYEEKTPQYNAMAEFAEKNLLRFYNENFDVDEIMGEIMFEVQSFDSTPDDALDFMGKAGRNIALSKEKYAEFAKLYVALNNNTRNPYNNGFTPTEMLAKISDYEESSYIVNPTFANVLADNFDEPISRNQPLKSKKIGRNEPCPCGSGKKYKKCCGR
jgi:hypothetical protein